MHRAFDDRAFDIAFGQQRVPMRAIGLGCMEAPVPEIVERDRLCPDGHRLHLARRNFRDFCRRMET
jgi:hypothetical protein